MYKCDFIVRLPDTDAAGILFYGNYFRLAHEAYEALMGALGYGLKYIIDESEILLLIAHSEADYRQSLCLDDEYSVDIRVEKLGDKSFTLAYNFVRKDGQVCATLRTVHVALHKGSQKTVSLPEELRIKLADQT
ncbi:MAG: thioesterase family protein [Candidatus Zixiibacteriota bacterium]